LTTTAAYRHNDAIAQQVEFYSCRVLPGQVRAFADGCEAGDMEAIAAFVLACAAHALGAIAPLMQAEQVDAVAHLEQYRVYLETIWPVCECSALEGLSLEWDEVDACLRISDLAGDASSRAWFRVTGHLGEFKRRKADQADARDAHIINKAFDLLKSGTTHRRNLNSKLRDWQRRKTGKALSKPAMDAVLKAFDHELLTYTGNLQKK
jgi:hypothetical protein